MNTENNGTRKTGNTNSVLVQVDEETFKLLEIIRGSVSSSIASLVEELRASAKTYNAGETANADLKKLTKRVDSIEDKLDDISDTVETIKLEVKKINTSLNKMMTLLDRKTNEEK